MMMENIQNQTILFGAKEGNSVRRNQERTKIGVVCLPKEVKVCQIGRAERSLSLSLSLSLSQRVECLGCSSPVNSLQSRRIQREGESSGG